MSAFDESAPAPAPEAPIATERSGPLRSNAYRAAAHAAGVEARSDAGVRRAVDRKKRAIVKAALDSGEELPLAYILDHFRTNAQLARAIEKDDLLTRERAIEAREYRHEALAAAIAAAPFLHAKLAPIIPKGEKGQIVQLIIEDA